MHPLGTVLVDEVAAFLDLAATLTPEQAQLPTECPGWTVLDQVAHVVHLEGALSGLPQPEHAVAGFGEHVRGPAGQLMEVGVDARRHLAIGDLVAEGRTVLAHRRAALQDLGPDDRLPSPFGPMPLERALALRTFDVWAHEQDVRRALGLPVTDGTPAAEVALQHIVRTFPAFLGKTVGLSDGRGVRLEVGDVATTFVARDGRVVADASAEPDAVLVGTVGEFLRVVCGRVPVGRSGLAVTGDPGVVAALEPHLAMTP